NEDDLVSACTRVRRLGHRAQAGDLERVHSRADVFHFETNMVETLAALVERARERSAGAHRRNQLEVRTTEIEEGHLRLLIGDVFNAVTPYAELRFEVVDGGAHVLHGDGDVVELERHASLSYIA